MSILFEKQFTLETINEIAIAFLDIAKDYDIWALSGQLGAGKTTFTAAVLRQLNVEDSVSSPTFSIINQYLCNGKIIYHSDWYRIGDEEEAINTGIEDMLQQSGLKIIEWWERVPELLPSKTLYIYLSLYGDKERKITVSSKVLN